VSRTATAAASALLPAAVLVVLIAATDPPPVKYCVQDQQQEERIHRLMSQALDDAFKAHISHLFDIWVKDPAEQPARAVNGASTGVNAYVRAQRNLQGWHPPRC
jgi:hypothetical protein